MKSFQYHEPDTLREACSLLSELGEEAKLLAGGTDLIVRMKRGDQTPKNVINIKKIKTLDFIQEECEGYRIGALTRLSDIVDHEGLREYMPVICSAARSIGSAQVRNIATLGGNLCNAAPSADMAPGLLVLDANVTLEGLEGERTLPLESFFLGPGSVDLKNGEVLKEISVPFPPPGTRQIYIKHGPRHAMDIAVVGIAVALTIEKETNRCNKARISLGAVAPTPLRAQKTEELIQGKQLDAIPMGLVSETVRQEATPISDVRGSAEYRTEMISTLTVRAINQLIGE